MSSELHRLVKERFLEACELEGGERRGFLERLHREAPDVAREVDALLRADAPDTDPPSWSLARVLDGAHSPAAAALPERIGGFRVVGLLGEGGMGRVYEAEQEHPRRRVALKVIASIYASPGLLKRFEYESELLARLSHPGIAQIFEAGACELETGAPQPYFAMELIDGEPITQWANRRELGTRARLELMARVCDAMQHAHQRGVIHRDLKPANILVDASGQPKVLDFGVAKLTDADVHLTTAGTATGQLLGTLPYMSPEQVEADALEIDARSDVYALGVVLYELLLGRLPYDVDRKPIHEVTRIIREREPMRPSSVDTRLRGDVETIVLHALEKDRERRYQSANELQRDIERFLRHEAISARPPSVLYQLRVFARRNKVLVGSVAAIIVVLAASTAVSTSLYLRAETEREISERKFRIAREGADLLIFGVCKELPQVAGTRELQVKLLKEARRHYERLAAERPGDHRQAGGVRTGFLLLGDAYLELGDLDAARAAFERCRALVRAAVESDRDSVTFQGELSQVLERFGKLALRGGDEAEAERFFRESLDIGERLRDREPHVLLHVKNVAILVERLGRLALRQGDLASAEETFGRYHELCAKLVEAEPDDSEYADSLALGHDLLGVVIGKDSRRRDESAAHYEKALEISERLVEREPRHPRFRNGLAVAHERMGDLARERGDLDAARKHFEAKRDIEEFLVAAEPRTGEFSLHLALTLGRLGELARMRRDYDEARRLFADEMLPICERLVAEEPANSAYLDALSWPCEELGAMASASSEQPEMERAAELLERTAETFRRIVELEPKNDSRRYDLMKAQLRFGRHTLQLDRERGRRALLEALESGRALLESRPGDPRTSNRVAQILGFLAESEESADATAERTRELIEVRRAAAEHPRAGPYDINECAWLLLTCEPASLRDHATALRLAERAVEVDGGDDPTTLDTLALALARNGRVEEAAARQREAIARLPEGPSSERAELEARLADYEAGTR